MTALHELGFSPFFDRQLETTDRPDTIARIATHHRDGYEAWTRDAAGPARLAGRLRTELDETGVPGVGDWVILREPPDGERITLIERVLARRTGITRGTPGRAARTQVVAANVDLVFVVAALDTPLNLRRIERFLARVWASGAMPCILLNKADLCDDTRVFLDDVASRCPGVPVQFTSTRRAGGVDALRASIGPGVTAAFVGPSGAGKSSLVNALVGDALLATGAVRADDGRGRHVTTRRQLVRVPGGGLLLDTPGLREIQLADDEGLDAVFDDVGALAARCRFRDCRHEGEPGCAVRAAVDAGELDPDRVAHHRQLEREAEAFERRHDARARKQAGRTWGQLHAEAARLRRWKGH